MDMLLNELRDSLRRELGRKPVEGNVVWLKIGKEIITGEAMSEFALQEKILAALRSDANRWRNIPMTKSTSDAHSIFDLLGDREHGRDFDLHIEKSLVKGSAVLSV